MVRHAFVEVIDLEKDRLPPDLERPKIMLFVWVVGVAKIVIHRDGFDDALDSLLAKRSNAGRDDGEAAEQVLTQLIVERARMRSVLISTADLQNSWLGEVLGPWSRPEPFQYRLGRCGL